MTPPDRLDQNLERIRRALLPGTDERLSPLWPADAAPSDKPTNDGLLQRFFFWREPR